MLLYLINPYNALSSMVKPRENRWNRFGVWKPLGLLVLAGLTPRDWEIRVFDENVAIPDYAILPPPDLVGITAFTSQVNRAYVLSAEFRGRGIMVVMGGIHATMCSAEVAPHVDAVVMGEAESVWGGLLDDFKNHQMKPLYTGTRLSLDQVPAARHDLLPEGYFFGSIQISRGCPLSCSFCSVTAFNGGQFRRRPIANVIEEFRTIKEKYVLIVDDNLIGTRADHIAQTKQMLRELIAAKINKKWVAQVTVNMADDDELLRLAKKAGCFGVFIGFESGSIEGLEELHKRYSMRSGRSIKDSIRRIQKHGMTVVGSFIMGLDVDQKDIGRSIARSASKYGVDMLNILFLTPLPGTKLWDRMHKEDRIIANNFPEDWRYYTLTYPVARYQNLSWSEMVKEKDACNRRFYSYPRMFRRVGRSVWQRRNPLFTFISNFWYRTNTLKLDRKAYRLVDMTRGDEGR